MIGAAAALAAAPISGLPGRQQYAEMSLPTRTPRPCNQHPSPPCAPRISENDATGDTRPPVHLWTYIRSGSIRAAHAAHSSPQRRLTVQRRLPLPRRWLTADREPTQSRRLSAENQLTNAGKPGTQTVRHRTDLNLKTTAAIRQVTALLIMLLQYDWQSSLGAESIPNPKLILF